MGFRLMWMLSIIAYGVLTAAVLICVGLTGNALLQANDRLHDVDAALTSVGGHADPLTDQVAKVNTSLETIEKALNPLHGQADQLNGILAQVQQTLTDANGVVSSVNGHAAAVESHLRPADANLISTLRSVQHADPEAALGATQAAQVLALLNPIQDDLFVVKGDLAITLDHLISICNKLPNNLLSPVQGC